MQGFQHSSFGDPDDRSSFEIVSLMNPEVAKSSDVGGDWVTVKRKGRVSRFEGTLGKCNEAGGRKTVLETVSIPVLN